MPLITLKTEASIGALADRLYPNLNPESRKVVEAALLKANPHLARVEAFRPGAVVSLPDIPGLKPRPAATGQDPVAEVLDGLQEAVSGYRARLAKGLGASQADLEQQSALLKQKEVAAVVKSTPEAAELAKNLTASLRERDKALAEDKKRQGAAFGQIEKDIDSLRS